MVNQTVDGAYAEKKNTMAVNGSTSAVWLLTFFKISSFVFNRRK